MIGPAIRYPWNGELKSISEIAKVCTAYSRVTIARRVKEGATSMDDLTQMEAAARAAKRKAAARSASNPWSRPHVPPREPIVPFRSV